MKGKLFKYLFIAQTAIIVLILTISIAEASKKNRLSAKEEIEVGWGDSYIIRDKKYGCEYLYIEHAKGVTVTLMGHEENCKLMEVPSK